MKELINKLKDLSVYPIDKVNKCQRIIRKYLYRKNTIFYPLIQAFIKGTTPFNFLQILSRRKGKDFYKKIENQIGKHIMKECFKIEKDTNQWSNLLGEYIVRDIYKLFKKDIKRPKKKKKFKPDWETDNCIIEVKTRNYATTGTAGDKVPGVPIVYQNIPDIYNKKVLVVVVGYQEYEAEKKFNLFDEKKNKYLKVFKVNGYEFIRCTSLLSKEYFNSINK